MSKATKPTPTVDEQTPTPTVDKVPFEQEHIDNLGPRVATVTFNPEVQNAPAVSNEPAYIHNLFTGITVKIAHASALDLIKTDSTRYTWATEEQIAEHKENNNG